MSSAVPLSLMICNHVLRDPRSVKYTPSGELPGIGSSGFPLAINLAVYFAITEGQGELSIRIELVDVDEERPALFSVEGRYFFGDPRQVIEGCFAFDQLNIPEPGDYRLKLFAAGEFLTERPFEVAVFDRNSLR